MSTNEKDSEKKPKVVKTPEQIAQEKGLSILKSGIAIGKSQAGNEQKDPLRKRLTVMLNTIAGRKEKGKTASFKAIKTKFNSLDDDRDDYVKAKGLYETVGLYLSALDVPEPKAKVKKEEPKTTDANPEPSNES